MSAQTWAAQWRELLTIDRRLSVPDAFAGARPMQLAEQFPADTADPEHRIVFEHGVLALFDEGRREVLLLAVPSWAGETWRASDAAEQEWISAAAESAAEENRVDITALRGPGGAVRTVYTRVEPLGEPWLLPTEPSWEFSLGTGGFSEAGRARVQDFADAVGRAGSAFLAAEDYPLATPTPTEMDRARRADSAPAAPGDEPVIPLAPPVPPRSAAPIATGTGAATSPAAAGAPAFAFGRGSALTPLRLSAIIVAFAVLIGIVIAAGVSRGYSVEVVDQEARAATQREEPTGRIELIEEEDRRICGGDEDYLACVNKHDAVYQSACAADDEYTEHAADVCRSLKKFVADSRAEYAKCDTQCLTALDEYGLWGWPYLTREPETRLVSNQDALERKTHIERCSFDLGPFEIGECGR
ncbi:hypothetical protein JD292_09420 [Leucobacter sp. CSA2]|uniref:Uncharacterized protein n=1 Tax=Leucobacter edaphi TaxID=2796472 RepID=A0A934QCT7_9MICO|nr:hypothetical protein [Leucobacter edaphi]MBK0422291.1 hypothetical protein [Leucobacter edaphi]